MRNSSQDKLIKVCLISPTFPFMNCGVGDYTLELIKSLTIYNIELMVITSRHNKINQFIDSEKVDKLVVRPIIKSWGFRSAPVILKNIKDFDPNVIHIQYHWWNFNNGFLLKGLMAVCLPFMIKFSGIKESILVTLHSRMNGPYLFPKAAFLRKLAMLPMFFFSDKLIVTNRFDGKKISTRLPFLKSKIIYIAGGTGHYYDAKIADDEVTKLKKGIKSCENEILLSNFGFMIPYKGLEELLEAMSHLRKKGYHLKLLAVGGFDIEVNFADSYFEKLQELTERLELKPFVNWVGFCDRRKASLYLLASDICVMPFSDGASEWRSSFLDALSHGLPTVTTCTEKTPREFVHRVNAMLVKPKRVGQLAEAIEELINSPQLRKQLGDAAKELYFKEYAWPIIACKTLNTYLA